ncbi:hypothetical protein BH23GEM6_BH23GEM6_00300 [soil metagenome]
MEGSTGVWERSDALSTGCRSSAHGAMIFQRRTWDRSCFTPDETHLEALLQHPSMVLGDTGFLLVEFGFDSLQSPAAVIQLAADRGLRIIVAHPERYAYASPGHALEICDEMGGCRRFSSGEPGKHPLPLAIQRFIGTCCMDVDDFDLFIGREQPRVDAECPHAICRF